MARGATVYHVRIDLSDVERGVYDKLNIRLARHPSESERYLATRLLAYCLCYEPGIELSGGGLSRTDEPPVAVRDETGAMIAWIDVGSPSAERLHKAAKLARRVLVFTSIAPGTLHREIGGRPIHRANEIELWHLEARFLDALGERLARSTKLALLRNEGELYATLGEESLGGTIQRSALAEG